MRRSTGFTSMRVLATLVGLAIGGPLALAQDAGPSSSVMKSKVAATSQVSRPECPSEPVTIWYLNNPQAAGGMYNDPWADCKLPATPR
jgi:hypothetical protein